jgi:hypothetical protein
METAVTMSRPATRRAGNSPLSMSSRTAVRDRPNTFAAAVMLNRPGPLILNVVTSVNGSTFRDDECQIAVLAGERVHAVLVLLGDERVVSLHI